MGHIHRISHTVTNDTRQPTPQITTLPHSWSAQSQPRPDPHRLFPIRSNPRPGFLAFSLRARYEIPSHSTARMNGHVSGLETRLWGREQSEEYRAVIKGGDDKKITEESPITCEVCSAHLQTSLPKQGWLFLLSLLVSYLLEAKAQNGICPRRSFRSS